MRHPRLRSRTREKFDFVQAVRQSEQPAAMPTPLASYAGVNSTDSACGCAPPDPSGDVGPNHYIQSVNFRFKILDKSGAQLVAPTTYNSLFAPLGPSTPCGNGQNRGDGTVFYDHLSDRWVVSDFAYPNFPGVRFYQCIGVSKTSDPVLGGWWLYALEIDSSNPTYLGDYPKFAVWPDAYYMTVNLFSDASATGFRGVRVFALDRNSMIDGGGVPVPRAVAFTITTATLGDTYSLVPAGFRTGSPPPLGQPAYFLAIDSPQLGGVVQNHVRVWQFHADFDHPENSTFGSGSSHGPDGNVIVNDFIAAFTNTTSSIVPQNGTNTLLDTLGDKIMHPVVYQNVHGVESLWAVHTVNNNQNGTGPTAIRWYQFDITGGTIPATPVQQQTWNNGGDGLWRWLPSIAVDGRGNVAVGYSVSSSATEPSIRYAGRLAGDPLNLLAQGEAEMQAGGGHQTNPGRWGDYSALSVDPADNSTFWHTNEFYSTTGSGWDTRIGAFQFPPAALQVASVVSRKTHGAAGTLDIPLPGVECRQGGTSGDHTFVFTFNNNVTSGEATVSAGAGRIVGRPLFYGATVMVNLTDVTDAQAITVMLRDVTDVFSQVLPAVSATATMLIGDTNGNGLVNASDIAQTKVQIGRLVTGANFRTDINSNGAINSSDVAIVRAHTGQSAAGFR